MPKTRRSLHVYVLRTLLVVLGAGMAGANVLSLWVFPNVKTRHPDRQVQKFQPGSVAEFRQHIGQRIDDVKRGFDVGYSRWDGESAWILFGNDGRMYEVVVENGVIRDVIDWEESPIIRAERRRAREKGSAIH